MGLKRKILKQREIGEGKERERKIMEMSKKRREEKGKQNN